MAGVSTVGGGVRVERFDTSGVELNVVNSCKIDAWLISLWSKVKIVQWCRGHS